MYDEVEPITIIGLEMKAAIGLVDTLHIYLIDVETGSTSQQTQIDDLCPAFGLATEGSNVEALPEVEIRTSIGCQWISYGVGCTMIDEGTHNLSPFIVFPAASQLCKVSRVVSVMYSRL